MQGVLAQSPVRGHVRGELLGMVQMAGGESGNNVRGSGGPVPLPRKHLERQPRSNHPVNGVGAARVRRIRHPCQQSAHKHFRTARLA
eukprot:8475167-Ditylum_brightwellii.AAC.1